jgi:hypothetical protein
VTAGSDSGLGQARARDTGEKRGLGASAQKREAARADAIAQECEPGRREEHGIHARQEGAYGIRTRVTAVRGRRPRPLDECAEPGQG